MSFSDAANPRFFHQDPHKFWFFYGHRYNIYREKFPHQGFKDMLEIGEKTMNGNYFVFTSNVDNHFSKAGFDDERIIECHGSIMHFQCPCKWEVYEADVDKIELDETTYEAKSIPKCPGCDAPVRPNILMFGDFDWISDRTYSQEERFRRWISDIDRESLTIIESGAGENVPTIRRTSEDFLTRITMGGAQTTLIRINPRD